MRRTLQKLYTRLAAAGLVALMLLCIMPAADAADASGVCGDGLTWVLNDDVLTISGSGAMTNFPESSMAPWYEYRDQISKVSLPEGLTSIGNLAFYGCDAITSVSLPNSVQSVGVYAFSGCSGLVMLNLGTGLQIIGEAGFKECSSLRTVRLPSSLTDIEYQAFYRCESLVDITVPGSVTNMGTSVFGYCYDLIRADVQADISELPNWTFYGCSSLTDVYLPDSLEGVEEFAFYDCTSLSTIEYDGSSENEAKINSDIEKDLAGEMRPPQLSSKSESKNNTSSTIFEETDSGDIVTQTTTTITTENADIITDVTVNYKDGDIDNSESSVSMDITLETAEGWDEVTDEINKAVENHNSAEVDVYVKDSSKLAPDALDSLAGKPVAVTIHDNSGSAWKMDCGTIEAGTVEKEFDISYERVRATDKQNKLIGSTEGYQIKFASDMTINAEVMIKLPVDHARQPASLFQVIRGKAERLQSVVVDTEGYAHFYLASVDSETEYLIGINATGIPESEVIVPEKLHAEYGVQEPIDTIQYVITGRKSSWGVNIGQVTWILVGVLFVVVSGVGITMFMLNKRKLKMGYVPDLDEEWEG